MTEKEIAAIQAAAAQIGIELIGAPVAAPAMIAQDADQVPDEAQDDPITACSATD